MAISIDFTKPESSYPAEPMDWNTGNPFDVSEIYPQAAGLLFLGRHHDCAHTRYYIDDGLVMELQTTAINQPFGLFVARPAGELTGIHITTVFDIVESLRQEIRTSDGPRQVVPFLGSIGVVANDAQLVRAHDDDFTVEVGLSPANKMIGATCAFQYDPEGPVTNPPSAPPSAERFRLNAPALMYSDPRPKYPFHAFDFLRSRLSPHAPGRPSLQFTLEMTATAATDPDFANTWMRLSVAPFSFDPDGGPDKVVYSNRFQDFNAITYAGVVLSITDGFTTWLQPSMGPLRARIKKLEVDFSIRAA